MKKVLVISTLIATSIISAGHVKAEASTEQNVGTASGALVGAAVGGPIGLVFGAVFGSMLGEQVEKANELDDVNANLVAANQREQQLKQEIAMIQENLQLETTGATEARWVTEGLTLNLMFTTNSSSLSDADFANISRISSIMSQFPELNIRLDGYTDPRGSKADNMLLSQQRVDAVIAAFESKGISPERLVGIAHGEINGQTTNADLDAFAMARKVSVNFVTEGHTQVAQN